MRRRTISQTAVVDRKAKELSKKARSLRDLMHRLEMIRKQREAQELSLKLSKKRGQKPSVVVAQPPDEYTGKPIDLAKGYLPYPVVGNLQATFGRQGITGLTHKGVTINAMSEAQVIAPYEGRVAFTGLFRGYGRLLIIEHGAGYHTLLAGMGRIDVIVGQWLLGGEPVGVMDRVDKNYKGDNPSLYIELRRGGEPINPLPWLAERGKQIEKSKVSG
jgi:septal ring factor EnvC (AmiA/AmiB activator)